MSIILPKKLKNFVYKQFKKRIIHHQKIQIALVIQYPQMKNLQNPKKILNLVK